jgi:hypothetical protein
MPAGPVDPAATGVAEPAGRWRGRKAARVRARRAAAAPMAMTTLKPFSEGRAVVPKSVVICARTTPAMALANDVPMDRIRVLRL